MKKHAAVYALMLATLLAAGCNQSAPPVSQEAPPPKAEAAAPPPAKAETKAAPASTGKATDMAAAENVQVQAGKGSKFNNDAESVSRRIDFVRTLVESSSAAKQIEAKGTPDAIAMREKARSLLKQAEGLHAKNKNVEANELLSQASNTMFQGVRASDSESVKGEKAQADFGRRLESVKVLYDAHQRIAKEKNNSAATQTGDKIKNLMDQAVSQKDGGKVVEGRKTLDEAYVIAKLSIEKMRRGDTLVRSLHFNSKEEEYHYEIDRNDTHKMLVKMLVSNKGPEMEAMVAPNL
ncbi:MAG: hypothetical protein G8345_16070, partial [Magnetococcales bacterium]|nr:hypothetical protein [Magnetococcales bacterium]